MREMLTRTIGSTIEIHLALSPDLWPALIDPTQIETAILNLAINARDAMPSGGELTIETRNLPAGAASAPAELAGRDCVGLSVRDTGTGMPDEVLRSAVEPFFTTKEPGKGSGLGLSQVYGTVQQSNGAMEIESRVGLGTAVHLFLPRALAESRRARAGARAGGGRADRRTHSGRRRRSRRARDRRADAAAMRVRGSRGRERTGGSRRARTRIEVTSWSSSTSRCPA